MRRGLIAFDRTAAIVIALVLLAAGAAGLGWRYDLIPDAPRRVEINGLTDVTATPWWPWASGGAGVLLVVLGIVWLARHLPHRASPRLRLSGTDPKGRLTADAAAAADTAGRLLAQSAGVRTGSGRIIVDRGQLVAQLTATLEPGADLEAASVAAAAAAQQLRHVVGRDDLRHRVELRVARTDKTSTANRVQ